MTCVALALASLTVPWRLAAASAGEFEQVSSLSFDRFPRFFSTQSGEWAFLRYDSTGNGAEIVRLDPLTGTAATLVNGLAHETLSLLLYSDARIFLAVGRKYGDQGPRVSGDYLTAIAGESQKAVVTTYKVSADVLQPGSATARILAAYPQALAIAREANDPYDCGCSQQFSDNIITCRGIRSPSFATTGKAVRVPSLMACERGERAGDIVQGERLSSKIGTARVVGYNDRYAVVDVGKYQQPRYEALRVADASRVPIDLPWLNSAQQFIPTPDPDRWLVVDNHVDQMRWIAFDAPRSRPSTLLRVGTFGYLYAGASAIHGSYLYVGLGRDLLVHDMRSNTTLYYERDFVVSSRPEKREGLDYDRLQLFLVDRDRLIAITRDGARSQTLDLLPFERTLESLGKP